MKTKVCIAAFIIEDNEDVQKWTKFSSSGKELFVPTLEFKGTSDEIEEQLEELTSTIITTIKYDN